MNNTATVPVYKWEAVWLPLIALLCSAVAYSLWHMPPTAKPATAKPIQLGQAAPSPYIAVNLTPRTDVRFPDMSLPYIEQAAVVYQPYKPQPKVKQKKKPNTLAFIGHIGRALILDEVDSFARRATLIVETHEHMQEYLDE